MFCVFSAFNVEIISRLLRKLVITVLVFFTLSCVTNIEKLAQKENILKEEGFYSSYLALEYLKYSRSLLENDDYINAQYFAKKGLDVADGYSVEPENPRFWHVNPVDLESLITAQKRYEKISRPEINNLLPIQMAHLAFLYDCWVTKEIKPAFRYGELAKCKDRFYSLIDEIEYFIENYGKKEIEETEILEAEFDRYLIFFDFDRYQINEKAKKDLVQVLNIIDELDGNYSVVLVGNADRVDKYLYNENLALNRARSVRGYMLKNGVPRTRIEIRVAGEEFPELITKDGDRQQFNRTTQIYIVRGRNSVQDIPLPVLYNRAYKQSIEREKRRRGLI